MPKLNVLTPAYYSKFQCIGSKCEDNCCTSHYEIVVNQQDYNYLIYKARYVH